MFRVDISHLVVATLFSFDTMSKTTPMPRPGGGEPPLANLEFMYRVHRASKLTCCLLDGNHDVESTLPTRNPRLHG